MLYPMLYWRHQLNLWNNIWFMYLIFCTNLFTNRKRYLSWIYNKSFWHEVSLCIVQELPWCKFLHCLCVHPFTLLYNWFVSQVIFCCYMPVWFWYSKPDNEITPLNGFILGQTFLMWCHKFATSFLVILCLELHNRGKKMILCKTKTMLKWRSFSRQWLYDAKKIFCSTTTSTDINKINVLDSFSLFKKAWHIKILYSSCTVFSTSGGIPWFM